MLTPMYGTTAQAPSMVQLALWAAPARFVRNVTPRRLTAPCYGSRALSSCCRLAGFKESKLTSCSRAHPPTSAVEADQRHVAMAASGAGRTAQCCSGSASRFLRSATNPSGASITASRLRKVAIGCIQVAEGSLKAVRAWIARRAARAMSGASPACRFRSCMDRPSQRTSRKDRSR
jgi:hypothetical protein